MKVNFYLQNPKQQESWIYLVAFIDKTRMKFYTSIKVPVGVWDPNKQRIKPNSKFTNKHNYNRHLDYLEQAAYDKYFDLIRNQIKPSPGLIKTHLEEITHKRSSQQYTLLKYWDHLIDKRKADPTFSPGTVKTYKTSYNHFIAFCRKYGTHDFDQIDLRFIDQFIDYLYGKKHSTNYVEKMVQQLRVMMQQAFEQGITTNQEYKKKGFRIKKTPTDEIYLTLKEINEIAKLDLSDGMAKAQQCFLLQCFTGAAYADIGKIHKGSLTVINEVPIISYYRGKTKKMASLPVHPMIKKIMDAREWEPFKPLANQPYNRYLKDIAEAAGIKDEVRKMHTPGGIEQIKTYRKYQLVGSHTARRSFTTNYILSGGTRDEVKLMIGHMKQDVTETYIRAEMQKRAVLLADREFFK